MTAELKKLLAGNGKKLVLKHTQNRTPPTLAVISTFIGLSNMTISG
jgi:hypothetical protein